jgi:hypothetical protein
MFEVMVMLAAPAGAARASPARSAPAAGMSFESFTFASLPTIWRLWLAPDGARASLIENRREVTGEG